MSPRLRPAASAPLRRWLRWASACSGVKEVPSQPSGGCAGVFERPRAEGGKVDGDAAVARLREPQRLAFAAGQRQLVVASLVGEPLAGEGELDDVHGLAHARERRLERPPLQALHHLRAAGAQAEQEAVAGNRRQGERRHRRHARRPGADLHDAGAEPDALGAPGKKGQRRHRVLAPRLRAPDGIDAEPLGFDDEVHLFLDFSPGAGCGAADANADFHASLPCFAQCARLIVRPRPLGHEAGAVKPGVLVGDQVDGHALEEIRRPRGILESAGGTAVRGSSSATANGMLPAK